MTYQDILATIQTCASVLSLIVSLIALNKVNEIKNTITNRKSNNKQTAIGKNNTQNME